MSEQKLNLKDVALIGRTFDEYYSMFNLSNIDKEHDKILDAAAGISSFCCEAAARGYNVHACDRIYEMPAEDIFEKAKSDVSDVMGKMPKIAELYNWKRFCNVNELKSNRLTALGRFTEDYEKNRENYSFCEFPESGFDKEEFAVTLSSHFLFMYDEMLGYEFHRETVYELLRISSKEVRIFPLVNLKGQRSPFVSKIVKEMFNKGYRISIDKVNYEFVKNGNEMLRIQKY